MTSEQRITFNHPFRLGEMTSSHEPGTFDLVVERFPLDVSWEAHRLSYTLMLISGGTVSAWPVTAAELDAALKADKDHDVQTGYS